MIRSTRIPVFIELFKRSSLFYPWKSELSCGVPHPFLTARCNDFQDPHDASFLVRTHSLRSCNHREPLWNHHRDRLWDCTDFTLTPGKTMTCFSYNGHYSQRHRNPLRRTERENRKYGAPYDYLGNESSNGFGKSQKTLLRVRARTIQDPIPSFCERKRCSVLYRQYARSCTQYLPRHPLFVRTRRTCILSDALDRILSTKSAL